MKIFFRAVIIICIAAAINGCTYDKEELLFPGNQQQGECGTTEAKFNSNVLPIITTQCAIAGCHDAATVSGGHAFLGYTQVYEARDRIYTRVVVEKSMPATGPLPTAEINIIKCWLESGAPNN